MMTLCDTLSFPIAQKVRTEYDSAKTGNKLSQKINKTHALYVIKDNLINFFVKNMYYKALDISESLSKILCLGRFSSGQNFMSFEKSNLLK